MTKKLPLLFLQVPLLLLLAGCAAISSLEAASEPLEIYELRTPKVPQSASRRNIEIVIAEPTTTGALATERIMIRPTPLQAQYLPGVRWADTAPVMVQTLMVRSLAETDAFGSVGRGPVGAVPDFTALSELTDFQAETAEVESTAIVRVRMVMRLVRESDAKVVATRTFSIAATAGSTDTEAIVAAFDESISRLLPPLVSWIARNSVGS